MVRLVLTGLIVVPLFSLQFVYTFIIFYLKLKTDVCKLHARNGIVLVNEHYLMSITSIVRSIVRSRYYLFKSQG